MMKKVITRTGIFCLFIIAIVSCKTSGTKGGSSELSALSEMEYLEEIIVNTPTPDAFSSKLKLSLNLDGKQISVNGTLRMKKDDVIQISITPLLGIEVAKIEITKDNMLIIDRMNKQYVSVPFTELPVVAGSEVDFYTLQSLFFNELFLPGQKELKKRNLSGFNVRRGGDETIINPKKAGKLNYNFVTLTDKARLVNTEISSWSDYRLKWTYDDFKVLTQKRDFPSLMDVSFEGKGKWMKATFNLSRMTTDDNWASRTNVSAKYKQIDYTTLIQSLFSM